MATAARGAVGVSEGKKKPDQITTIKAGGKRKRKQAAPATHKQRTRSSEPDETPPLSQDETMMANEGIGNEAEAGEAEMADFRRY
jgi:hypothetical protein